MNHRPNITMLVSVMLIMAGHIVGFCGVLWASQLDPGINDLWAYAWLFVSFLTAIYQTGRRYLEDLPHKQHLIMQRRLDAQEKLEDWQ